MPPVTGIDRKKAAGCERTCFVVSIRALRNPMARRRSHGVWPPGGGAP